MHLLFSRNEHAHECHGKAFEASSSSMCQTASSVCGKNRKLDDNIVALNAGHL